MLLLDESEVLDCLALAWVAAVVGVDIVVGVVVVVCVALPPVSDCLDSVLEDFVGAEAARLGVVPGV